VTLLPLHVLAGALGLISGYVALSAAKGGTLPVLLAIGVLLPIVAMVYWLWRVRIRKTFLGIVGVSTPQVSGATK
jgi:hypothetical protein